MIWKNFIKNSVTSPVFELEQCSLDINGVEIEKDVNGDQLTLFVISIPTKNGQSKKEQTIFMLYIFKLFMAIHIEIFSSFPSTIEYGGTFDKNTLSVDAIGTGYLAIRFRYLFIFERGSY